MQDDAPIISPRTGKPLRVSTSGKKLGRPTGPSGHTPLSDLGVRLRYSRQQLADAIQKSGLNIFETLVRLTQDPDPTISLSALALVTRYSLQPLPPAEERVNITLPPTRTAEEIDAAIAFVADEIAAGRVPHEQANQLLKSLNLKLSSRSNMDAAERLARLEQQTGLASPKRPQQQQITVLTGPATHQFEN